MKSEQHSSRDLSESGSGQLMLTDEQTGTARKAETTTPATPLGEVQQADDIDETEVRIQEEDGVIGPLAKLRDL